MQKVHFVQCTWTALAEFDLCWARSCYFTCYAVCLQVATSIVNFTCFSFAIHCMVYRVCITDSVLQTAASSSDTWVAQDSKLRIPSLTLVRFHIWIRRQVLESGKRTGRHHKIAMLSRCLLDVCLMPRCVRTEQPLRFADPNVLRSMSLDANAYR